MIYILNKKNNVVITESWLDYIPEKFTIKFDEIIIGEFYNESHLTKYISFTIPKEMLINKYLENMEYMMTIIIDNAFFKKELITIVSDTTITFNEHIRSFNLTQYEK